MTLIKLAGQSLHVTEILFFRQITMVAVSLPAILHGFPGSLKSQRVDLQLMRIGLAFGAMMLGFTAVIHLPLAEVTTLGFSKTFFMTIMGIVMLGEVVRVRRWAALAVGFAGVLIILWPSGDSGLNIYGLASIASAFLVAMVMVLIRKLSQVDRPITILSYQAIGVGVLMFVPMLWFWKTPTLWEAGLLVLIGVIAAVGQFINILALRAGETSALAPLDFTRLVFAGLLGLMVFGFVGSSSGVRLVEAEADDDRLKWSDDRSKVRIIISRIGFNAYYNQTLIGRQIRFRKALKEQMESRGWRQVGNYQYVRDLER